MIVRILSEGQFQVPSAQLDRLNRLDNAVVDAVAKGKEAQYKKAYARLLALVREKGQPVPDTDFVSSDAVLPHAGLTLEEAKSLFVGDGLIPG